MLYVFGKTLICRNMEVATSFARKHGLDCITLGMIIQVSPFPKSMADKFEKRHKVSCLIKNKMVIRFLDAVLLPVVTLIQRDPAWNFITLKSVILSDFFQ